MRYIGNYNPYGVKAIWELRLREEILVLVYRASILYRKSMSWVIRYCVFSLLRDKSMTREEVRNLCAKLQEKNQKDPKKSHELRRFKVCLYGEDEKIFLDLKARYEVPTSLVIRVAIHLYIDKLLLGKVSSWEFFWYGLKFFKEIFSVASGKREVPQVGIYIGRFLSEKDYWAIPPGPYPPFLMGKNLSLG